MHAVPKAHLQREQVRHWSWIWATVTAALQAQAQNLMHWTALGLGLGIAAYFGVSREPGAAVFLAVSLSASLCAVLAVRLRNGIARLLIVISGVAVAITVGDRMYLDRDVQQTLRAANLSHLLAISGLHMGLLTSRVFFFSRALMSCLPYLILNWPIKKIAALISMGVGAAYLCCLGPVLQQSVHILWPLPSSQPCCSSGARSRCKRFQ